MGIFSSCEMCEIAADLNSGPLTYFKGMYFCLKTGKRKNLKNRIEGAVQLWYRMINDHNLSDTLQEIKE